jgi:hemoglobin
MSSDWTPSPTDSPYQRLGGTPAVRALVKRFYDVMGEREPALARLHKCDADGRVSDESRDRFGLFLIGWLGGPQDYIATHGHPRLRMRHGHLPVDTAMRDAWMRSMTAALDEMTIDPGVRKHLDTRLADLADFLRNM